MSNQTRASILVTEAEDLRNFSSASFYVQETTVTLPHQTPSSRIDYRVIGRRKPCDDPELSERLEVVAEFGCPNAAAIFAAMAVQTAANI